jgi:hypothetical protein
MDRKQEVEIELAKVELRVQNLEKVTVAMGKDLHKIVTQLSGMKWFILGAIAVESPQAIDAIKNIIGGG